MSHQYFAEPLQLLAVTWILLIISLAPQWNRALIVSQLLAFIPVAMIAKVSSPVYCSLPALLAMWQVLKKGRVSFVKDEWLQKPVLITLAAAVVLNLAVIAWYYRNITDIIHHVSIASSGPVAELYGKRDSFLNALLFWLEALQNAFFLSLTSLVIYLIVAFGVVHHLVRRTSGADYFAVCSAIAAFQILIVLSTFSFNSNRDIRFLLPLLPYLVLPICWSARQIKSRLLTMTLSTMFAAQLVVVYAQAFGLLARIQNVPPYLVPVNANSTTALTVDAVVSKTCTDTGSVRYLNIVGDSRPWLNVNTLGYVAAKALLPHSRLRCYYGQVGGYFASDLDTVWDEIISLRPLYYITSDPSIYPIAHDKLNQALNRLNIPLLAKIQTSNLFETERLREDPGILLFRKLNILKLTNYAEAFTIAEHGEQSVRGALFGKNFELLGAYLTPTSRGTKLQLAWRCIHETQLEYMVAVHLLDERGKIQAQADFSQDVGKARVTPGMVWVDHVNLSHEKLKGARKLGIALYIPGSSVQTIDRGPRDWDGHRLVFSLDQHEQEKG
jgi:hypothetical protein